MKYNRLFKATSFMLLLSTPLNLFSNDFNRNRKNKPVWTPTPWQLELPPIVFNTNDSSMEFSFTEIIEADGYLCPGSARCYKTLQTALPILYPDTTPTIGDFIILYGPSECATRVFDMFLSKMDVTEQFIELDNSLMGREMIVKRISTQQMVKILYDIPSADGHNPDGASVGDTILKAKNNAGMIVTLTSDIYN